MQHDGHDIWAQQRVMLELDENRLQLLLAAHPAIRQAIAVIPCVTHVSKLVFVSAVTAVARQVKGTFST